MTDSWARMEQAATELKQSLADALLTDIGRCYLLCLRNFGIHVEIPWIEGYPELRDRIGRMSQFRHWLSFRLRRRYEWLKLEQQQAILNAVIEQGQQTMNMRKRDAG